MSWTNISLWLQYMFSFTILNAEIIVIVSSFEEIAGANPASVKESSLRVKHFKS